MNLTNKILFLFILIISSGIANAGYKMHYPQYPDSKGLDVIAAPPYMLADDWQCNETGPITGFYIWGSWFNDVIAPISSIYLSIHNDIPDPDGPGPLFSMPGQLIWECSFYPGQFEVINEGSGTQGWFEPPLSIIYPNHVLYHRINISNLDHCPPLIQEEGTIYWLDVSISASGWGWKTSLDHFNDDAVYLDPGDRVWKELRDPRTMESLDLAFGILGDKCAFNLPPTLNFLYPSENFLLANPQVINWSWSDPDSSPEASTVYLFYTLNNGVNWFFITAVDPDSSLPAKGYGEYIWDTSAIFAMDPLPSSVSILGIIYDGCDVGLSDPSSGATQAGSGDPTDPYDLISGEGLVPEFTTIGLIAVLAVVVSLFIVQKVRKKKSSKKTNKKAKKK